MEWFEEWFNTEEYLNVYRHRNDEDAKKLSRLILKNISIPNGGKVLDMACGAGRHSIIFAQHGYNVTAVDLSENLLKVAKRSAEEANVKVNFINADLRDFCVEGIYDLAINLFTSFGYFDSDEENFAMFKDAFHHLNDNGFFVLDYFNSTFLKNNLVIKSEDEIPNGKIIQQRKIEGNRVIKDILICKNGEEKKYHESVRMYDSLELTDKVRQIGFDIVKIFGDFEGNDFDKEKSQRIIIIAKK